MGWSLRTLGELLGEAAQQGGRLILAGFKEQLTLGGGGPDVRFVGKVALPRLGPGEVGVKLRAVERTPRDLKGLGFDAGTGGQQRHAGGHLYDIIAVPGVNGERGREPAKDRILASLLCEVEVNGAHLRLCGFGFDRRAQDGPEELVPKAEPKAGHVEGERAFDEALQGEGPGTTLGVMDAVVAGASDHDAGIMMEDLFGEGGVDGVVGGDDKACAEVLGDALFFVLVHGVAWVSDLNEEDR